MKCTRKEFIHFAGFTGLYLVATNVLVGCGEELTYGSPPVDALPNAENKKPWETPDVLGMGIALGGLKDTDAISEIYANGFRVKDELPIVLTGETQASNWWMIKNPSGGAQTSVWFNPERNQWLKVLHSNANTKFTNSIEAMRASYEVSGISPGEVVETVANINGKAYRAMQVDHYAPSIDTLLRTGRITAVEAGKLYETSYINAIRLAREKGFWFGDSNLNNVLAQVDDTGEITGGVLNIDFTNKKIRIRSFSAGLRNQLADNYARHAELNGIPFNAQSAETILAKPELIAEIHAPMLQDETLAQIIDVADDGTEAVVEEIRAVDTSIKELQVADDVYAVEAEVVGSSRVVRLLKNPIVQGAGKVVKFVGDVGFLFWAVDKIDGPDGHELSEVLFYLYNNQNEYPLGLEDLHDRVSQYKDQFRFYELPGADVFVQEETKLVESLITWGFSNSEITNILANRSKSEVDNFIKTNPLPIELVVGGPVLSDQARTTGIAVSAQTLPNGTKTVVLFRKDSFETVCSFHTDEYGNWVTNNEGVNPTVNIAGTQGNTESITGYLSCDDNSAKMVFDQLLNN